MANHEPLPLQVALPEGGHVSALLTNPADALACYVFAHGAGAGMEHPFMASLANELAHRRIATLRYQFPYMEQGSKRPDSPAVAQATVRAAVGEAHRRLPNLPLFAGGKSFGGRMTSQAQATSPLESVQGLAFVGFPLHAAGKPSVERAAHLAAVQCPMLFLQGTRDALADLSLLKTVLAPLGDRVRLATFEDADHAFHVRVRSGTTDAAVLAALADTLAEWFIANAHGKTPA
jgi:predicted alpha/beta-hydrolase family hydrolase